MPKLRQGRSQGSKFCDGPERYGLPLAIADSSDMANATTPMTSEVKCPRRDCSRINPAGNAFCYYCGAVLGEWLKIGTEPGTLSPVPPPVRARLKLPDNREISLDKLAKWLGWDDLNGLVPEDSLNYISRQHLIIWFENGQYYVEDQNSTNGTRLNGTEIKGKGKYKLNNGDLIEVADVIAFSFETS
jgi:hypothetical protein